MNITAKNILMETIIRIDGAYAPSTIRAYKSNFERFIEFCEKESLLAIPANQETVASYIKTLSNGKLKSASIRIAVAAISAINRLNEFPDPTNHPNVKIELRRMHRNLGRESKQAAGINAKLLQRMLKTTENNLRGLRDKALLLTAYDSMCRRSELGSITFNDLILDKENKAVRIKLRRSKTDQDGHGCWLYLSELTQEALMTWIINSNLAEGMLFRGITRGGQIMKNLSSAQINRIYKKIAINSKIDSSIVKDISGHSMRVGAAQDLLMNGASMPIIMNRGRWSKIDTAMRYVQNADFSND